MRAVRKAPPRKGRVSRTNAEYSAQTQRQLMIAARREFARAGYGDASIDRIVGAANLTRGALYHHYRDKRALFEAVFTELEREIAERVEEHAARRKNAFDVLVAGCNAWLDACLDDEIQRIVLLDGPAVLGWRRWMEIDARYGAGLLRGAIDACIEADLLVDVDAATLTQLLSGGMNETALLMAQSADATVLRRAAGRTLRSLLDGLRRKRPRRES